MKCGKTTTASLALVVAGTFGALMAGAQDQPSVLKPVLRQPFDLGGVRSPGTQYFDMVSTFVSFGLDGKRSGAETFRMQLKCVPRSKTGQAVYQYTCRRFVYVKADGTEVTVPALEGWSYTFKADYDETGRVFGIDHSRFERLADSNGDPLAPDKSYLIYNTFIDFHAFCDTFAAPVAKGNGIQHLTRIGQKVIHAAALSTPPVNLGSNVKEGSYYRNGEITLAFKGLSIVDDAPCAVVEFDSGEGSFKMLMEPVPGMEVETVGASHYFGDIYLDLASKWTRKVDMRELIISETSVPIPGNTKPMKIHSILERHTVIKAVTQEEYETD